MILPGDIAQSDFGTRTRLVRFGLKCEEQLGQRWLSNQNPETATTLF